MSRSGRNDHRRVGLDLACHAINDDFALALLDPKELVAIFVNLPRISSPGWSAISTNWSFLPV